MSKEDQIEGTALIGAIAFIDNLKQAFGIKQTDNQAHIIQAQSAGIAIALGNISGLSIIHKFGRNAAVPNGSWEQISSLSVASSYLEAATTVRVKAGNAADDAAGAGAQSITVVGIDTTLAEVTVILPTAGASAGASSTESFLRIYRAYVTPGACGTYGGNNTGNVVIENTAGTTDLIQIAAGKGQSQHGSYSVPTGYTAYVLSALITVDAGKAADIRLCTRASFNDVATPFEPVLVKRYFDGVLGVLPVNPITPIGPFAALSDIWWDANGGGAITEVSVDFEILLVAD